MITVVALLFFPAVFAMSVFRLYQLPRHLARRSSWFNPDHRLASAVASATTYLTLAVYTLLLLYTLVKSLVTPPRSLPDVLEAASVVVGYPIIYLVFEWVRFYSIRPRT